MFRRVVTCRVPLFPVGVKILLVGWIFFGWSSVSHWCVFLFLRFVCISVATIRLICMLRWLMIRLFLVIACSFLLLNSGSCMLPLIWASTVSFNVSFTVSPLFFQYVVFDVAESICLYCSGTQLVLLFIWDVVLFYQFPFYRVDVLSFLNCRTWQILF